MITAISAGGAAAHVEADLLEELTALLGQSLSLDDSLAKFSERLKQIVAFDAIAVYMRQGDFLPPKFVRGEDRALFSSLKMPIGEGLSGWVAQNRRPIINGNPSVEPGYLNDPAKFSTLRSALAVPLESAQGEVLGVLVTYAMQADKYNNRDLGTLQAIAPNVAAAIENAVRFHLAETQASTDFLTRALQAKTFLGRLEAEVKNCSASDQVLSLVLCDLDAFREVNENFGHAEGNRFLSKVADCFRDTVRDGDCVGRLGGDEFALLLPGLSPHTAEARVRDLRAAVRDISVDLFGNAHIVTASLGVASFPEDGTTADQLMEAADQSMRAAKRTRDIRLHRELGVAVVAARG